MKPYAIKVGHDWSIAGTAEHLEKELHAFKFKGPGLYVTDTDTLLIVSVDEEEHQWGPLNRANKQWHAYVWNCPIEYTLFVHNEIPIRQDSRRD